jgi:hypothetical protein
MRFVFSSLPYCSFLNGSVQPDVMRRIGLPWSPELVQRTLIGERAWQ